MSALGLQRPGFQPLGRFSHLSDVVQGILFRARRGLPTDSCIELKIEMLRLCALMVLIFIALGFLFFGCHCRISVSRLP